MLWKGILKKYPRTAHFLHYGPNQRVMLGYWQYNYKISISQPRGFSPPTCFHPAMLLCLRGLVMINLAEYWSKAGQIGEVFGEKWSNEGKFSNKVLWEGILKKYPRTTQFLHYGPNQRVRCGNWQYNDKISISRHKGWKSTPYITVDYETPRNPTHVRPWLVSILLCYSALVACWCTIWSKIGANQAR